MESGRGGSGSCRDPLLSALLSAMDVALAGADLSDCGDCLPAAVTRREFGEGRGSAQPPVSAGDFKGHLSFGLGKRERAAQHCCAFALFWTSMVK